MLKTDELAIPPFKDYYNNAKDKQEALKKIEFIVWRYKWNTPYEAYPEKERTWRVAKDVFNFFDTDKSGFIERCELKPLLNKISKQLNLPFPEEKDIDEGLKQLDLNKDGKLQFSEFLPFYEQIMIKL